MSAAGPELRFPGDGDGPTSPRTLVAYTLYEPDGETVDHRAWDAIQPNGVVGDSEYADLRVIGFALVPPNTAVGRFEDREAFSQRVETVATYTHWRPGDDRDVTGTPAGDQP